MSIIKHKISHSDTSLKNELVCDKQRNKKLDQSSKTSENSECLCLNSFGNKVKVKGSLWASLSANDCLRQDYMVYMV